MAEDGERKAALETVQADGTDGNCVTFVLHDEDHTLGNSLRYMVMKKTATGLHTVRFPSIPDPWFELGRLPCGLLVLPRWCLRSCQPCPPPAKLQLQLQDRWGCVNKVTQVVSLQHIPPIRPSAILETP
ncbi:uncharacterized protein LOC102049131 isoform X1 [Falco cherrug]|uniref:uncharacterized protein LOC102049131 isoform X1 n=1 Tax=Falco cherrug TaxID=345164 RepID=UPI002478DDA7|nr:uncharacterized protein LOC102049131 isoform X1 [Falco cherrug]